MNQDTIEFIQELIIRLNRRQLEICDKIIEPETDLELQRSLGYLEAMKEVNSFLQSYQWPDQYETFLAKEKAETK